MNGQKGDLKEQGIMRKPTDLMVVLALLAYGLEDALARSLDERPPVRGVYQANHSGTEQGIS